MSQEFVNRVVELTNQERAKQGLSPLTLNAELSEAALEHSTSMALNDFVGHSGSDGSLVGDRVGRQDYILQLVGENVAAGQTTPEEVVAGWMESPQHRENILKPEFEDIGIGYYFLENDTGDKNLNHYWTQVFGDPYLNGVPIDINIPNLSARPTSATPISESPVAPENNPFYMEGFFDLTANASTPDLVQLTPGALNGSAMGLRALGGDDVILGSPDGETMNGNKGRDRLYGNNGNDYLRGGKNNDEVFGDEGDDILNGNNGSDLVYGGNGNDMVRGGRDNDYLFGDAGNDVLIGDFGADLLTGGAGADVFVLRSSTVEGVVQNEYADWITDFNLAEGDKIGLTDGLTENDINYLGVLDVNNNGVNDAILQLKSTNEILGIVLDIGVPFGLAGQFETVSADVLAMG